MKRRLSAILMFSILLLTSMPMLTKADELEGLTLETEMRAMIEKGILQGYGENDYRPKGEVTREQFAAFLARTLELPGVKTSFIDVNPSAALAPYIGAIELTGYMKGTTDKRFKPTDNITREEMALTMSRVVADKGLQVEKKEIKFEDEGRFTLTGGLEAAQTLASMNVMSGGASNLGPNTFIFNPKSISTRDQIAAVLYRYLAFANGTPIPPKPEVPVPPQPETPKPEVPKPPVVDKNQFQLATIENKKLVLTGKTYKTYSEVVNAFNANPTAQGIYKGKELLRVRSGQAFAEGPRGNNTIIYSSPSFGTQLTYIEAGREMRILEHAENYMKVQVADTEGYVKHSGIDFMPTAISDNRDYYIVNASNELVHNTYNYLTKSYGSYSIGPKAAFMQQNTRYYSPDGVHFLNSAGTGIGTYHPYFQFQSIRTKTSYTAAELNNYIAVKLTELQRSGVSKYANATKVSKLINTGTYMKEMESKYRVNALFILATAIHESDYGISNNAMTKNNLFGIRVFDSTPEAGEMYATPQRSIEAFILEYMNKNYGQPLGAYAKGAVPGNKTAGFNAHYASDPTWGSKIGGHMWRIDSAIGKKDYKKYRLAMTNRSGILNVRTEPVVNSSTLLFTYKPRDTGRSGKTGYPVAIVEQKVGSDGFLWYKVLSDDYRAEFGWIRGDYLFDIAK